MQPVKIGEVNYKGEMVSVYKTKYTDNESLAIIIRSDYEPIATLSVNIPEHSHLLGENEFWCKRWSENEYISQVCLDSGLFEDTCFDVPCGYCFAERWRIK